MYHAVDPAARTPPTRDLSVTPEAFAEQMALLGERGFTPGDHRRSSRRRLAVGGRPAAAHARC